MIAVDSEKISAVAAAKLFKVTRPTFYALAKRHEIEELTAHNPAQQRPERRVFRRDDVLRVYRTLYGKDPEAISA